MEIAYLDALSDLQRCNVDVEVLRYYCVRSCYVNLTDREVHTTTITYTLCQTYENFEIIVKDGFSTDGSVEKLPADDRIRLVRKKDTGIYDAMNQAV